MGGIPPSGYIVHWPRRFPPLKTGGRYHVGSVTRVFILFPGKVNPHGGIVLMTPGVKGGYSWVAEVICGECPARVDIGTAYID